MSTEKLKVVSASVREKLVKKYPICMLPLIFSPVFYSEQ